MATAPYAIETQSNLWVVSIEHGPAYEEEIQHLFFRGSDLEEVWGFLCRYLDDVYEKTADPWKKARCIKAIFLDSDDHAHPLVHDQARGYSHYKCVGITQRHMVKNAMAEDSWDHHSGGLVSIKRMDVIEFRK